MNDNFLDIVGNNFADLNLDDIDIDGDGQPDIFLVDSDGDGIADMLMSDSDSNGMPDVMFMDTDGDGEFDTTALFDDVDGDGVPDALLTDTDGDGVFDTLFHDTDGDGIADTALDLSDATQPKVLESEMIAEDTDGDGINDTFTTITHIDTDNDGKEDAIVEERVVDSDHDGHPDEIVDIVSIDKDGDGIINHIVVETDQNGDRIFDTFMEFSDDDEDGSWTLENSWENGVLESEAYNNYGHYDPNNRSDGIIGDPDGSVDSWHAQQGNTCAIVSQEGVLEDLFGRDFDEDELREIAEDNGWYAGNGTTFEDIGKLLEYYGANVERSSGNTYNDIREALAGGHPVIVAVDGDELWNGQDNDTFGPGMDANHAIQVTGLDESDPNNIMFIVNDSGVANGNSVMIPADVFMSAWEDSGGYMVTAEV